MKIESLHVGMKVRHPQYGVGAVKTIGEHTADVRFDEGLRTLAPDTCGLEPAEAQVSLSGLELPLNTVIADTVRAVIESLGFEKPDARIRIDLGGMKALLGYLDPGRVFAVG